MPIQFRDRLVQLEGTLERLFGGRPPREPLEVRRAVVESLVGEVRPVGGGRRVLPVGRVTVAVLATDATEKRLFNRAGKNSATAARQIPATTIQSAIRQRPEPS